MNTLDAFEAIRRKHLRQNRDIIKVNNLQAIRIKSLETEISKLNAENLELRAKIIELREQINREKKGNPEDSHLEHIKNSIQNTIKQLTGVLGYLEGSDENSLGKVKVEYVNGSEVKPQFINPMVDEPLILSVDPITDNDPIRLVQKRKKPTIQRSLVTIAETADEEDTATTTITTMQSFPSLHEVPMAESCNFVEPRSPSAFESQADVYVEEVENMQDDMDICVNFKRKSLLPSVTNVVEVQTNSQLQTSEKVCDNEEAHPMNGKRKLEDSIENTNYSRKERHEGAQSAPSSPNRRSSSPSETRSSRRARKSVNYALPSLRVKMRREDPPRFPVAIGTLPEWSTKNFNKKGKSIKERDRGDMSKLDSFDTVIGSLLSSPVLSRRKSLSAPSSPGNGNTSSLLSDPMTLFPDPQFVNNENSIERSTDDIIVELDRRRKQRRESFHIPGNKDILSSSFNDSPLKYPDTEPLTFNGDE